MDIRKQIQLVRRIQCDLRKEAHKHRGYGMDLAASACEGQADALDAVLATLKGVGVAVEAFSLLSASTESRGSAEV